MGASQDPGTGPAAPSELDLVVREVLRETHLRGDELRPEERQYLKEHALNKPMGVLHIWALGVGVVITGEYFGWNLALKNNGPVAVLIASLIVWRKGTEGSHPVSAVSRAWSPHRSITSCARTRAGSTTWRTSIGASSEARTSTCSAAEIELPELTL